MRRNRMCVVIFGTLLACGGMLPLAGAAVAQAPYDNIGDLAYQNQQLNANLISQNGTYQNIYYNTRGMAPIRSW